MLNKIIDGYKKHFEEYGGDATRNTFNGELNYESGKQFYLLFVAFFAWIPYIRYDLILHPFPVFAVSIRVSFSLVAAFFIYLRFTKRFKNRPDVSLTSMILSLYIFTALVTATAGEHVPGYIGGLTLVLLLPALIPLRVALKYIFSTLALILFFVVGAFTGLDYSNQTIQYAFHDLLISFFLSFILSYTVNAVRYKTWEQQQTISKLADQANAASAAKSKFLARMSHEIRTPMNAIAGIAQIQLQKNGLPDEHVSALEKIYDSCSDLLGIVNDILDTSKIETGKLELSPVEYDTPSFINNTVQLNIVRIGSKPLDLILDIDENLPSRLYGDELRLRQILNNLLSNAIKYTEKGRVKMSVKHFARGENVMLRFVIEDTGQGMRPEDRDRLFSEYTRFNADVNRATEGTGLGLNIAKQLVDMMDGTISVESEYGRGSEFTVTVKQAAVESPAIGADVAKKLSDFTFNDTRKERRKAVRNIMPYGSVLIVDDVGTNLYVAEGLLLPYELKVETADSGFAAIDKVKSGKVYDIIFMDHMMPQMDGVETTQKIRELGYTGAIVALTANALIGNSDMFMQSGFDGFVSKPIDMRHLDAALNKHIRDRYPQEAAKYKPEATEAEPVKTTIQFNPRLLQIFCRDTEKAAATLRKALADGNMKLYITTVHAMKTALTYVGEYEAALTAAALEKAGLDGDMEFINANTGEFAETLVALTERLRPDDAI